MTDRIAELRAESRDLIALLQRLGDGEHDDLSVAHDALAEIINLRLQRAALLDCAEALAEVTATLAWQAHGECRATDRPILSSADAVAMGKNALARLNGDS